MFETKPRILELASTVTGRSIDYLTHAQQDYMWAKFRDLPKKYAEIIEMRLDGKLFSERCYEFYSERYDTALALLKQSVNNELLTCNSISITSLVEMSGGTLNDSYESLVKKYCERHLEPDKNAQAYNEFEQSWKKFEPAAQIAIEDCYRLLSGATYKSNANAFAQGVLTDFALDNDDYLEGVKCCEEIAKNVANENRQYCSAIQDTISRLIMNLEIYKACGCDMAKARKRELFRQLDIDTSKEDLALLYGDSANCPILQRDDIVRLIEKRFSTMSELMDMSECITPDIRERVRDFIKSFLA